MGRTKTSTEAPGSVPVADFETKDSGERAEYANGFVRDTDEGKPNFGLLLVAGVPYAEQPITRHAELLTRGAAKYHDRNWEQAFNDGDVPAESPEIERAKASAFRHLMQFLTGETDEDHASAVKFNVDFVTMLRRQQPQPEAAQQTLSGGVVSDDEACGAVFAHDTENPCVLPGLPKHDDHVDQHGMRWYGDPRPDWEACAERHRRLDGAGYAACIRRRHHRGEHDHRTHMVNR